MVRLVYRPTIGRVVPSREKPDPEGNSMPTNPQPTPTRDGSSADQGQPDALLTPGGVATLFRGNPKTVIRWARAGQLTAIRTLRGHRRFRASEIRDCLDPTEYQVA